MKITTQVGRLLGYSGGNVGGGAEGTMATITGYEVSPIQGVSGTDTKNFDSGSGIAGTETLAGKKPELLSLSE